jgi:hypothetical protein
MIFLFGRKEIVTKEDEVFAKLLEASDSKKEEEKREEVIQEDPAELVPDEDKERK